MAQLCQCLVRHCQYQAGQCLMWFRGLTFECNTSCSQQKPALLLSWRMPDSLCCVDKLLITTNWDLIQLTFVSSYFWETNKQKVICPPVKDAVHQPLWQPDILEADLWLSGSHPQPSHTQITVGAIPNRRLWEFARRRVGCQQLLKTFCWCQWAQHCPSVDLVALFWENPKCKSLREGLNVPVIPGAQEVTIRSTWHPWDDWCLIFIYYSTYDWII